MSRASWRLARRRWLGATGSAALLAACGGGGGGGTTATSDQQPIALRFASIDASVAPGQQLYLRVMADRRDGTSEEVTLRAVWASSQPLVASFSSNQGSGVLTAAAVGRTEVSASYQGLTATLQVTVANNLLRRIEVSLPHALAIGIGGQFRIVATAHYTDRSQFDEQDLTWTSSNTDVLSVSNESGLRGTVTGKRPGTATVLASKEGVSWSTELTVLNIRRLAGHAYGSADGGPDPEAQVRIDGSGRVLALFGYTPVGPTRPAAVIATRPSAEAPWSEPMQLGPAALQVMANSRHLAMNHAGEAIVSWQSESRLYAARYSPSAGLGATRLLSDAVSQGSRLPAVVVAADGSAMLAWEHLATDFKPQIVYSRFDVIADRWSAPSQVPGTELTRGTAEFLQMVGNESGEAVILWRRRAPITVNPAAEDAGINALMVSRFDPATGAGWQPAELLTVADDSAYASGFDVAMGDAGHVVVVWVQTTGINAAGARIANVRTRRFEPGKGWGSVLNLVSDSPLAPAGPRLAVNEKGWAVVGWHAVWDNGVWMSISRQDGNWDAPTNAFTPDLSLPSGTPQILRPAILSDGRALLSWRVDLLGLQLNFASRRYLPQTGWQPSTLASFIGRNFRAESIDIHFNRAGQGTAVWMEGSGEGGSLYTSSEFRL